MIAFPLVKKVKGGGGGNKKTRATISIRKYRNIFSVVARRTCGKGEDGELLRHRARQIAQLKITFLFEDQG